MIVFNLKLYSNREHCDYTGKNKKKRKSFFTLERTLNSLSIFVRQPIVTRHRILTVKI